MAWMVNAAGVRQKYLEIEGLCKITNGMRDLGNNNNSDNQLLPWTMWQDLSWSHIMIHASNALPNEIKIAMRTDKRFRESIEIR
jgi:hypothetical protein